FSIYTAGELLQLLNNAAKEAMKNAEQEPTKDVKEAMGQINEAGNAVKGVATKIDGIGKDELGKMNRKINPSSSNVDTSGSGRGSQSPKHPSLQLATDGTTDQT
ncbi:hypothetical protein U1Q18_051711, partial [Sarracenia purpurea var. burkii]